MLRQNSTNILKDFYYMRWKTYFDALSVTLNGGLPPAIDWYALEEPWTKVSDTYSAAPVGDCIGIARKVYAAVFEQ
ncbi:MAG: alpha-N-acetylglucosaminidase C-terminal domain-containing protein [Bacteroides sp.]|nr:alpha-N-acetylglucosaminidase C-terminal domain-containing protein [Bacteroides sp.]